ncbi:MAG: hypothetical protein N4A50_01980 [Vallitalea sp.]|jgi:hypothetical protein|nr:hypothetical protein [Vallitalea sp.]
MFFSKEMLQQDTNILYDDKEVIEVINDYYNHVLTQVANIEDSRKNALSIFSRYCKMLYNKQLISTLEDDFYNRFLLVYMPSYSLKLSEKELRVVLIEMGKLLEFINSYHGINLSKSYKKDWTSNLDDMLRVFYIIRKMQKYTDAPVLSFNPMIIDMNCYKKRKHNYQEISKREIYEQGYFEIIERIGGTIILKKTKTKNNFYVKLKVESNLAIDMHNKDIINMRIKKRFFNTTWDIIDMKDYYSYRAINYIF